MTAEELALHKLGMTFKFVYSLTGLLVGLFCIMAGTFLGLNGVVGHTSWTASLLGLSTNINDAAPGVIVFVVGIFFALITRFKVKHQVTSSQTPTQVRQEEQKPLAETEKLPPRTEDQRSDEAVRRDNTSSSSSYSSSISYHSGPKL